MSADNGIYVLRTLRADGEGHEYRVADLQAVENYRYDRKEHRDTENPDVWIANAREMWDHFWVLPTEDLAMRQASKMADDCTFLGYGISMISIDRVFNPTITPFLASDSCFAYLVPGKDPVRYQEGYADGTDGREFRYSCPVGSSYMDGWAVGRVARMNKDH